MNRRSRPRLLTLPIAALALALGAACGGGVPAAAPVTPTSALTTAAGPSSPAPPPTTTATPPEAPSDVPPLHPSVDGYPEGVVRLFTDDGEVVVAVKIAATPQERQHGLMEVPALPDGVGMLFVYEAPHTGGFWMKNTLVPLDIAYIGSDGIVVSVLQMDPCTADPCPGYEPGQAYQFALEVPQGYFERVGVHPGTRVELPAA